MIRPGLLRCKYFCAEYGRIVMAALVVLSVVAVGASVWVYTHPETEQVTEEVHRQSIEMQAETSTVVTGETPLWEEGTVLQNRPFYPTDAAPNLTLHIVTTVPDDQPVQLSHRVSLVYRAKRGDATIWQSEEPIDGERLQVSDGEAMTKTTISIPSVLDRVGTLSGALTGIGTVDVMVKLNASYQTNRYAGRLSATAPLSASQAGYWLKGDLSDGETHTTTITRVKTDRNEPIAAMLALLGILSAVGAVASGRFYEHGPDGSAVMEQISRERCFDWISEGRISHQIDHQDIEMHSLEDLVDVAIDSKDRVVFDPERNLYAVVDRDLLYYFDPTPGRRHVPAPVPTESPEPQEPNAGTTRQSPSGAIGAQSEPGPDQPSAESTGVNQAGNGAVAKTNGDTASVNGDSDVAFVRKRWSGLMNGDTEVEIEIHDPGDSELPQPPLADGGTDADSENGFGRDRWVELLEPGD